MNEFDFFFVTATRCGLMKRAGNINTQQPDTLTWPRHSYSVSYSQKKTFQQNLVSSLFVYPRLNQIPCYSDISTLTNHLRYSHFSPPHLYPPTITSILPPTPLIIIIRRSLSLSFCNYNYLFCILLYTSVWGDFIVGIVGNNFPSTFEATVKNIMTQLGRILCHVCHAHWRHVIAISMTTHLTALVRHFIAFVTHYKLVRSDELDLLSNLYKNCASSSPPTAHQRQVTVTPVTQTASPRDIRDAISDNSATSGLGRSPADDSCSSSSSDVSIDRLSNCSLTSAGLLPSHEDAASRRSSDGSGSYGNQKRMAQLRHHGEMTSLAEFRRASATSVDSGHWDTEKHVTRHNMELSLSTVSYLC